jgi:peptidoglycan/xylan/chitin deacetylase (PgdA/CDA1 family)
MNAFKSVFGFYPRSHAAAGWQINAHGLELEREYGLDYASDTRGATPFWPLLAHGEVGCAQLPTTLPTFDELLGANGVDEHNIAESIFRRSVESAHPTLQVFTLHAELEGMLLLDAFEQLLERWRSAGARIVRMAKIHEQSLLAPMSRDPVALGEVEGRSGTLAVQGGAARP